LVGQGGFEPPTT